MNKHTNVTNISLGSNVWVPDLGNGTYKNPIIYADYSDPDVIRVGDDFYMVASSFCNIPGIPLLHSKDLVNWKIVNYILEKIPYEDYEVPAHGRGVWAPSIRFYDNKFIVCFPMPDEGIFICTATDPLGKWSEPITVREGKGWIDPCPFWDDDGKAYLISAFAKSRIGFKNILHISPMKPDGTGLLGEGQHVFDGTESHPTIEGPKLYKRNGYYYIFAPAGGVKSGYQVVLRSKNIYGPYEDKIVLHQGNTIVNGPHQGAWIELESGESWFIHFQDAGACGRITHLQPMRWVENWPIMGIDINGDGIGEPVLVHKKPNIGKTFPVEIPATSDEFDDENLGLQWQWNANYKSEWYTILKDRSSIRLYGVDSKANLCDVPNLLLQKFPAPEFMASMKLEFSPISVGEITGMVVLGREYSAIALEKTENGFDLIRIKGHNTGTESKEEKICSLKMDTSNIYFRIVVANGELCSFSYSLDGEEYKQFGESFETVEGIWVGVKIGMFSINSGSNDKSGFTDIDWFRVESANAADLKNDSSIRIVIIGDSTASNYDEKADPMTGWGQTFHKFFTQNIIIKNHAYPGRSSKSFIDEGRWENALNDLRQDDYLFIQFGHNDAKHEDPTRFTEPYTTYKKNLAKYIQEARHKGANPILLTSIERRGFNSDGSIIASHGEYPKAMIELSGEMGVPLIDITTLSQELFNKLGEEKTKELFMWIEPMANKNYPEGLKDNTHFNENGAFEIGKLVIKGLMEMKHPLAKYLI